MCSLRSIKTHWSRKRKIHSLKSQEWHDSFDSEDGCLSNYGEAVVNKVRWGGIDPEIRAEVWPFLLGLYDLRSTAAERKEKKLSKREEYENLRNKCQSVRLLLSDERGDRGNLEEPLEFEKPTLKESQSPDNAVLVDSSEDAPLEDSQEIDKRSESCDGKGSQDNSDGISAVEQKTEDVSGVINSWQLESGSPALENFTTWQRIIRLDAVRMNAEWVPYSPTQANVSAEEAFKLARAASLEDDEHLEPCRQHHAARLVEILEAYSIYDPETGYCQGMSDLLSPFVALMDEDFEAFWCFTYFMRTARHNFRTDEVGIRKQLDKVSEILKIADSPLYNHLVKINSEDCTFVYRMVVVLLRRELSFEQTLCLWEVIWADWAALKMGFGVGKKPKRSRKKRAPPSNDLLLFTIAAAVHKKRKIIFERCRGMDDLLKECNAMAGHLDIWELLDDARELIRSVNSKTL
ncbi:hypothetical protein O6H91_13G026300 [Diphasiastrum complanatum]|uniref:Uncharacterized protein n=1 Tax=Diphasiastrum complanatum TaxID=34168 RepID=A0ACC2BT42_DIPCM|nr:hypothetical protein O6H91_13G026300 [Diphasiastrum complanatum]